MPDEVRALVTRIEAEQGGLHVLVNDIWGTTTMEWNGRRQPVSMAFARSRLRSLTTGGLPELDLEIEIVLWRTA